jgi:hypothetical protein
MVGRLAAVNIAIVPAEIGTEHVLITSLDHYKYLLDIVCAENAVRACACVYILV